jgi:hypothetical protein
VSESRSSYVTHQLSSVSQVPRGEAWSNTINLQKEYMDARQWQSESKATQAQTQARAQAALAASASFPWLGKEAAGETKTKDSKAPAFFAWPEQSEIDAAAQAPASEPTVDAASESNAEDDIMVGWVRECSPTTSPLLHFAS